MPQACAYRVLVESRLCPLVDWLLGIGPKNLEIAGRKLGRAPVVGKALTENLVQVRGAAGVRGSDAFASYLLDFSGQASLHAALRALGEIIDNRVDFFWQALWRLPETSQDLILRPDIAGAWADGVTRALVTGRDLMLTDPGAAPPILATCVQMIERFANGPEDTMSRHKHALYQLTLPIPWLCLARGAGALSARDVSVEDAAGRLLKVRDRLPDAVRQHGGRASINSEDEPISVAIDYLRGFYVALPSLDRS